MCPLCLYSRSNGKFNNFDHQNVSLLGTAEGTEVSSRLSTLPPRVATRCESTAWPICSQGDVCCWICDTCEEWEFVYNESTCADCGKGSWPYPDKRSCYELDVSTAALEAGLAAARLSALASTVT